jgi:hypothetical protein
MILLPTKRRVQEEYVMRVIEQGDKVQVHYVKVFQDGSIVSSRDKAPTELTSGPIIPGCPVGVSYGVAAQKILGKQD